MRRLATAGLLLLGLVCVSGASAKDFGPGDLRLCNAMRCIPVENRRVIPLLSSVSYGPRRAPVTRSPRLGAPAFELRFRNGYVTGIVASSELDRFLSYGVYLGRFRRGRWYRMPDRVSLELRTLARPLRPLRVSREALSKSR